MESTPETRGESSDSSTLATSEKSGEAEEPAPSPGGGDEAAEIEAWLAVVCRNIDGPKEEESEPDPEVPIAKPEPKQVQPGHEADAKPLTDSKSTAAEPEEEVVSAPEPEAGQEAAVAFVRSEAAGAVGTEMSEREAADSKTAPPSKPTTKTAQVTKETVEKAEVHSPVEKVISEKSELGAPAEEDTPAELKLVRPIAETEGPEVKNSSEAGLPGQPSTLSGTDSEEPKSEVLELPRESASEVVEPSGLIGPPKLSLGPIPAVILDDSETPEESVELVGAAEPPRDLFGAPEPPSDDLFTGPAEPVQESPLVGGGGAPEVDDIFSRVSEPPMTEPEQWDVEDEPAVESSQDSPKQVEKSYETIGMPKGGDAPSSVEATGVSQTSVPEKGAPRPKEAKSYETLGIGEGPAEAKKREPQSYETVLDLKPEIKKNAPEKSSFASPTASGGITLDAELLKSTRKPDKSEEAQAFQKTGQSRVAPGASLKFLEQALAKSVPGKLPEGLKKRSVTAIRYLFTRGSVQRAAVVAEDDQGKLEALAVGGFNPDLDSMQQIPDRLLRATKTSGKPLLMVDCIRDPRFAKDPVVTKFEVRSVVCIPFTDKDTGSRGFLYLDNCTAPNAFSYQDLEELSAFANKLATQTDLSEFEISSPVPSAGSEELMVEVQPPSPWWFVGALVAAIILITPALYNVFTKEEAPKRPQSATSQPIENPAAVIQGFIRSLDAKSYDGAYSYLSQDLQSKISQEDFDKKLRGDMEKYEKAWRLSRVNIRGGNVDQESLKSFRVTVGHSGPWNWTLQKSEGKWFLHEFDGGLSIP